METEHGRLQHAIKSGIRADIENISRIEAWLGKAGVQDTIVTLGHP